MADYKVPERSVKPSRLIEIREIIRGEKKSGIMFASSENFSVLLISEISVSRVTVFFFSRKEGDGNN